jgi:lipopolysaccharide export system permease protein
MSILTKYLCRRLIVYYFAFVGMMAVFFVFVDFMENIEMVTRHHAPAGLVALYYACLLPKVFVETSWVGFLVSTLFVLGSLAKNNEFTAMLAGGISIYRVGLPVFALSVLLCVGVFCVQELVVPETILRAREIDESDFAEQSDGRIFDMAGIGRHNRFYFFDEVDVERGILEGVHVHTMKGGSIVERIDAERAVWDKETSRWHLKNGAVKKFDANGVVVENAPFSEMKAPFRESPQTLKIYSSGTGEFSFRQLRRQIKNLERSGYDAHRLKVDYHTKFAFPVANIIVVLLALSFALECRRGGLTVGFALSLMVALLYYGTFQIGLALGKGGSLPAAVSAWLANFLFLGIGAALTLRART